MTFEQLLVVLDKDRRRMVAWACRFGLDRSEAVAAFDDARMEIASSLRDDPSVERPETRQRMLDLFGERCAALLQVRFRSRVTDAVRRAEGARRPDGTTTKVALVAVGDDALHGFVDAAARAAPSVEEQALEDPQGAESLLGVLPPGRHRDALSARVRHADHHIGEVPGLDPRFAGSSSDAFHAIHRRAKRDTLIPHMARVVASEECRRFRAAADASGRTVRGLPATWRSHYAGCLYCRCHLALFDKQAAAALMPLPWLVSRWTELRGGTGRLLARLPGTGGGSSGEVAAGATIGGSVAGAGALKAAGACATALACLGAGTAVVVAPEHHAARQRGRATSLAAAAPVAVAPAAAASLGPAPQLSTVASRYRVDPAAPRRAVVQRAQARRAAHAEQAAATKRKAARRATAARRAAAARRAKAGTPSTSTPGQAPATYRPGSGGSTQAAAAPPATYRPTPKAAPSTYKPPQAPATYKPAKSTSGSPATYTP